MRAMQILALFLLCVVMASAQTNKGGISGTVMDPNGAAVAGATVTVTNVGTNQAQSTTTSESGSFSVNSLDPVTYSILVEAPGFKRATLEAVKVDTATTASANIVLELGKVEESVVITSDAPTINTESGTTAQTVTERQIQDIPLNNRSVLDLAVTAPNVSGDVGSEDPDVTSGQPVPGFNLSLNGGRPGSTAILSDGVNNTGVGVARAVVSFSPETVQEFTVQTSAYDATFGNTGGGVISATTKSGTNRLNGVALWYTRNPVTNANKWTTGNLRPRNNLRTNQVSVTLGGPVVIPKLYNGRDKTFFFFAFEPRWRRDFVVTSTLLPTDAMRSGDFRNLARIANGWAPADVVASFRVPVINSNANIFQQYMLVNGKLVPIVLSNIPGRTPVTAYQFCQFGDPRATLVNGQPLCTPEVNAAPNAGLNIVPQNLMDPIALKALEFLPHAGAYFLNDAGELVNFVVNRSVQQDEKRYTLRLDHQLSKQNRMNFRVTTVPAVGIRNFGSDINGNTGVYSNSKQFVWADNHIFSATVVNDLRLNYTRGVFSEDFSPEFSIKGGRNLAKELGIPSLTNGGIPLFQTGNLDTSSPTANSIAFANIGSSGSTNNFNVEERYNINDVLYWNRGNQTWKFGVDLDHALLNVIPFFGASGGRWDFRVVQTSNNRTTNQAAGGNNWASYLMGLSNAALFRPVLIPYYYRWNSGALFVQNDWKVKPNLTLNLGMRYSLQFPRTEKYNHQGVFIPELAKEFPLTTPVTLAGRTFTTAMVPPFAYSGRGGRSKYIFPVEKWNFEPRFGFAWSPKMKLLGIDVEKKSLVIRGGYGISHAPLTGNNRLPSPDFGATNTVSTLAPTTITPACPIVTTSCGSAGTVDPIQPLRLSNPPLYASLSPDQALNIPADGLVYLGSLGIPGFALSNNTKVPVIHNWNLSASFQMLKGTVIEVAYVGSRGARLFMPRVNLNPRDVSFVELLEGNNLSSDTTLTDPLGRRSLSGGTISISRGSLATPFLGFDNLFSFFDASASSIRHAAYIDVRRRVSRGLTFTANYTFGKSIDTASDASPDTRVLTTSSTQGHATFGAPLSQDRSISIFDIKHNFSSTFIYDVPVGRKRQFLGNLWKPLDFALGGWTLSGLFRLQGGTPFVPSLVDTNRLSSNITHTVRPDIVPGVPLKNPLWKRNCPVGSLCEPYINPSAFTRPPKGALGSAPRTLDVRGPMQRNFDMSFQKNFPLPFGGEKRRVQFRVDLINAFNHPAFRLNNLDFMGLPDEATISTGDYDAWAASDPSRPARSTVAGAALFIQITNFVVSNRLTTGALPLNFFADIQIPQGFATTNATAFDIGNLQGYKLYRLRRAYSTSFGTLREVGNPRYVQFGIKIYF